MFNLILADHLKGGAVMRQVRTIMGVVAMDTAQSTRFVGAESLGVLGYGRRRNGGFRDRRFGERDFNHGLNMGQLRTSMGGMTSDITSGTRLRGRRRSRVGRGGLVFGCRLAGFAFLPGSRHDRRRVLWRCWGHSGYGGSEGDRLHRCQSHVRFGVTRGGGG